MLHISLYLLVCKQKEFRKLKQNAAVNLFAPSKMYRVTICGVWDLQEQRNKLMPHLGFLTYPYSYYVLTTYLYKFLCKGNQ